MYASKRQAFSYKVYEARVLLAALDYNFHLNRPAIRNAEGQLIFKRKYNKNARRYSVYSLKSEKGYEYIPVLQSKIINERLARGVGMPRTRSMRDDDPRRLGLVPPIAPPPISELVQIQVSRGLVSELEHSYRPPVTILSTFTWSILYLLRVTNVMYIKM
uniref:Uncharacterized protein n=1 Tax=Nothobranchius pienaari TaxID=704102 RepID=A0A1A8MYH2_9TELE